MKTETIQVMSKGKVVAEVEIERFDGSDEFQIIGNTLMEFFDDTPTFLQWLNKVYEAEVVRRTRKLATAPKVSKEFLAKMKKKLEKDPEFLVQVCKKLGIEVEV